MNYRILRAGRASLKCFCVSCLCAFFKWSRVFAHISQKKICAFLTLRHCPLRLCFYFAFFSRTWLFLSLFAFLIFFRVFVILFVFCRCGSSFSYHHPSKFKKFIECDFQISRAEGISAVPDIESLLYVRVSLSWEKTTIPNNRKGNIAAQHSLRNVRRSVWLVSPNEHDRIKKIV